MKILLAPDKFKGSLTAAEVCRHMQQGLLSNYPAANIVLHPMADGGEGTLDIIKIHLQTHTIQTKVSDPLFRTVEASYEYAGDIAYIEMSKASGLALLSEEEQNPRLTSTIGTGQLIRHAIEQGARKVFLFVGGSATNEAGVGMATALGYRFLDAMGMEVKPIGQNLQYIDTIDSSKVMPGLHQVAFEVVCDVSNQLCGTSGATHVYAPQKGAGLLRDLQLLEAGMKRFQQVLEHTFQQNIATLKGGGAAGGLGAGAVAFLKATINSGTATLMEMTGFEAHLKDTDFILTGEGKADRQTLHGKVVHGVAVAANKHHIPFGMICGVAEHHNEIMETLAPRFIKQITEISQNNEDALSEAGKYVETLAAQVNVSS